MGKIALTGGFSIIPEGTHVFKITEVNYKEEFGKMEIKMKTAKGQTHVERFTFTNKNGSTNDGAVSAFSFFARTALQDNTLTEIDHTDIVGRFIRCVVSHTKVPSTKDPNETVTFIKLGDKSPASGFEEGEVVSVSPKKEVKQPSTGFNLDSLLG